MRRLVANLNIMIHNILLFILINNWTNLIYKELRESMEIKLKRNKAYPILFLYEIMWLNYPILNGEFGLFNATRALEQ
jgi:hypothetical protein